jgi:hypothetical protein
MERRTTIFGKDALHSVPKSPRLKEWDAVERVLTMKWRRA